MNKIVSTTTSNGTVLSVKPATITDVINISVPLADAQSNAIRVGIYAVLAFLIAR